jgi:DNA/RNA endonuclease YhcR with UshA esterase domain
MKPVLMLAALVLTAAGLTAQAAPSAEALTVKGEVLATRDVDNYTYLRLKTDEGEIWAAVPTTAVKKGTVVTIGDAMMMENFESKALNKKFDKILFGQIIDPNPKPASPHGVAAAPVAPVAKVAKATGPDAKTIAEVVKGKAALKGKSVLVRGQVVKVNNGILGKNWLHLQDGSGTAADGTNDILVTTKEVAALGAIVTVKGTVQTDLDLGSGYAYAVLIADAAIAK